MTHKVLSSPLTILDQSESPAELGTGVGSGDKKNPENWAFASDPASPEENSRTIEAGDPSFLSGVLSLDNLPPKFQLRRKKEGFV
jgi:hypothetical protein